MNKRISPRRSSITYYIDQVAEGNSAYQDKLCQRLADRLLHIPLQAVNQNAEQGEEINISVQKIKVDGISAVPVFTNKKLAENWEAQTGVNCETITLIGADFCKVLEPDLALLVDPGSEAQVIIEPELVQRIVAYGDEALMKEFEQVKEEASKADKAKEVNSNEELKATVVIELDEVIETPPAQTAETIDPAPPVEHKQIPSAGLKNWLGIKE